MYRVTQLTGLKLYQNENKIFENYHSHLICPLAMPTLEFFDQFFVLHYMHSVIDMKFINLKGDKLYITHYNKLFCNKN